jgi:hypothetical protein
MRYLCLLIVMTPVFLMAADPVGRITGSGPLMLDGKAVPETAVSSLPMVAGDEIATSSSAATIFFADGSRATIPPKSRVKLEANGSSVALRVLSGSVELIRAKGSQVKLIQPILPAVPKSTADPASSNQTAASDGANKPPPPPLHPTHQAKSARPVGTRMGIANRDRDGNLPSL